MAPSGFTRHSRAADHPSRRVESGGARGGGRDVSGEGDGSFRRTEDGSESRRGVAHRGIGSNSQENMRDFSDEGGDVTEISRVGRGSFDHMKGGGGGSETRVEDE